MAWERLDDTDRLTREALEWFDGLDHLGKMRVWLEWAIANPEPDAVPMLVAVEDFTLTLDDGTVETFKRGRDRIVADHEFVALAGEHRFRPVSATEDGTAGMTLGEIAHADPDLARCVLEQRGSHGYAVAVGWKPLDSGRPAVDFRRVAATGTRRRSSHARRPGHRRTRSTRAGPSSDDSSEPEPPSRRRRVVVDDHFVVIGLVAA